MLRWESSTWNIQKVTSRTKTKTDCGFCVKFPCLALGLERVPRLMPHQKALDMPELCYLPFDKTPSVTSSGSQRDVDDYQPKAQV